MTKPIALPLLYHRKLRGKRNLESVLDHIDGIGPKRRKALWTHFNSLDAMKQATIDELTQVDSMNYKRRKPYIISFVCPK